MRFVIPLVSGALAAAFLVFGLYQPTSVQQLLTADNWPPITVIAVGLVGFSFLVQEAGAWVLGRFRRY